MKKNDNTIIEKNAKEDFKEDFSFLANKLSQLLIEKKMSERKLSIDLGHSTSYINGITSGKTRPSLNELLYICRYFNISPKDFFDDDKRIGTKQIELIELTQDIQPDKLDELIDVFSQLRHLKSDDLSYIQTLTNRLNEN